MTSPSSQTEELDDEYLRTVSVHGREYQQYSIDNQISFEPVDEDEAERLELQHRIFSRVFDGRLIFPPIRRLQKVLDCGYGAGSWAIDVAEQNPDCEVIGVDIYPHMGPDDMPENLCLQVDDLNRPFTFSSSSFDLVHSRLLAAGINRARWPSYIRDIKRVLKPGGWVQMVEIYFNVQSDNGSISDEHALRQWSSQLMRSMEGIKDFRVGTRLKTLLLAAGFTEVDAKMIPLPLSAWPDNPTSRSIGTMNCGNIAKLLASLSLYPLTQRLHMPPAQYQDLISRAQGEVGDRSLKAYFPL
ncbi:Putative UMTA methyltransferase family protein [Aspergillus calidoustus]|uniref:Putative UMTA methyltransferase family protein n=1 Tax=Aspergillus calidoustus TaxID=454130 RepID=A0A0U5C2L4_ASPCI|nr:Putative UMTA methyltransferase family protein [Aspergillus calidoustus]